MTVWIYGEQVEATPLLTINGHIEFLYIPRKEDIKRGLVASVDVYKVTAWECDDDHTPSDVEYYLHAYVKWDGCSHVWFGENDEKGNSKSNYFHICGKKEWIKHSMMMLELYKALIRMHENPSADEVLHGFTLEEIMKGDYKIDV